MNYDVLMILVLAAATLFGAWKGLAWQVASVASLVVSYFVALAFSGPLAPLFGDTVPWNRFLAMLVLYAGTSLGIWLLFRMVSGFLNRHKLRNFDRQMGAIVGAGKGVLFCVGITLFAVTLLKDPARTAILQSPSGRAIARLLERADAVVPPELQTVIGPYLDRMHGNIADRQTTSPQEPAWPQHVPTNWNPPFGSEYLPQPSEWHPAWQQLVPQLQPQYPPPQYPAPQHAAPHPNPAGGSSW